MGVLMKRLEPAATILPDGSVFIAGSNPNADVITEANNASYPFKTEVGSHLPTAPGSSRNC